MKKLAYFMACMILPGGAGIAFVRLGGLDADPGQALDRYGGPPSKFLTIDGVLMHYRDEGQGPILVLLHGSRASLHQWDGWVSELNGQFRIIRVDAGAHGLSGPDDSGDYSPKRQTDLLAQLLDHLKIDRFFLGGTSSGSIQAVRFAAEHPQRVKKLVLSTVPLKLPATIKTPRSRRFVYWLHHELLKHTGTDWYWRNFLENIFADPGKIDSAMVTRYRILNSLPNQRHRQQLLIDKWYELGGPDRDFKMASRVTSPVLVQWGVAGPVLPKAIQCEITEAFTHTNVRVISYVDLGHKLVMEDPTRTARDAARYLNGENVGGRCDTT
jgi:pimeloyl-ACP methyl ester carboxylesterase